MKLSGVRGVLVAMAICGLSAWVTLRDSPREFMAMVVIAGALIGLFAGSILVWRDRRRRLKGEPKLSPETPERPATESCGGAGVSGPPPEPALACEPTDPFLVSVAEELERIRNPRTNWALTLFILVISLLLFVQVEMRDSPATFTGMLVAVLLFHELGHYVGMRLFGYRNVRMFFIPLFGAAVSGQRTSAKGYQEAIVTLLGPLPGVFLGLGLAVLALRTPGVAKEHSPELVRAVMMLAFLNGFNLLPVLPLDGGRLLNQVVLCRNRYLEGAFLIVAIMAVIAYGLLAKSVVMVGVGIGMLAGVRTTFQISWVARSLASRFGGALPPLEAAIPPAVLQAIIEESQSRLPGLTTAKGMAGVALRIWERVHLKPPGRVATVGLLMLYAVGLLTAIGAFSLAWTRGTVERQIDAYTRATNRRLPARIDELTTWERVEAGPGRTVSLIYGVNKELSGQRKQAIVEHTRRYVLTAPSLRSTIDAGVTLRYVYHDPSHRKVLEFDVKQ